MTDKFDSEKYLNETNQIVNNEIMQDYLNWTPTNHSEPTDYSSWEESNCQVMEAYAEKMRKAINSMK